MAPLKEPAFSYFLGWHLSEGAPSVSDGALVLAKHAPSVSDGLSCSNIAFLARAHNSAQQIATVLAAHTSSQFCHEPSLRRPNERFRERIDPLATRGPIPVINIFKAGVLQAPINVALGIVSMPVLDKPAQ
jgi:hypothetical protein